jgi:Xaa-Pro aminopeptidase
LADFFTSRIKNLKSLLNKKNLSTLIILKDENIYYLTGFYGLKSTSILVIAKNTIYLIVSPIYFEYARKSIEKSIKNSDIDISIVCYKKDRFKKLQDILEGYDFKVVCIEGKNISYADFKKLEKILNRQGKKIKSCDGIVEELRILKDEDEISKIKKACSIADKAFQSLIGQSEHKIEELTEIEITFYIEGLMVKNGSEGRAFDIITAYGKNSSMPHYLPQNMRIRNGIILLDFGCKYEHYCSDITRTLFIGDKKISNEFKKIYDIVLEAQLMAIDKCREGVRASELDGIVRKFISSKGYGRNFNHGLGHGVGLEIHEEPVVGQVNKEVLKENMVVTIEPGIYIENFGGVRIEDTVLVKKNTCEVLNEARKDFLILSSY